MRGRSEYTARKLILSREGELMKLIDFRIEYINGHPQVRPIFKDNGGKVFVGLETGKSVLEFYKSYPKFLDISTNRCKAMAGYEFMDTISRIAKEDIKWCQKRLNNI